MIAADLPQSPLNSPTLVQVNEHSITITLEALDASRSSGSEITGYLVQIDDGLGDLHDGFKNGRLVHDSLETSLIIRNLVGGRTYKVRYAARNLVYDSANLFSNDEIKWSPSLVVKTAVFPKHPLNVRQS